MSAPRTYSLHGLPLEVAGWEPAAAAVDARLRRLAGGPGPPAGAPLRFEFRSGTGPRPRPPARARPVYDPPGGRVLYGGEEDLLYIEIGGGDAPPRLAATCRPAEGRAEIAALAPAPGDLWLLSHPLFTLPLCELAKRRGLFSLHAAGVRAGGKALLLPGQSGAGKSTLSIALARSGLALLGDDTVFLEPGAQGLRVLGFPDEVDLTEESAALLATLARPDDLLPEAPLAGARKRSLPPERLAAGGLARAAAPGWLVFPRIAGTETSELSPMSREEALLALAPDVLLTEPRSSQRHLDALAALVAASECYRLATGRDLAQAVQLLVELTS